MQISEIVAFLENAYQVLNLKFFGGELPPVVITVQSSPKAYGSYTPWESWKQQDTGFREINIGAETLDRPIENTIATLIHEKDRTQPYTALREPCSLYRRTGVDWY